MSAQADDDRLADGQRIADVLRQDDDDGLVKAWMSQAFGLEPEGKHAATEPTEPRSDDEALIDRYVDGQFGGIGSKP